SLYSVASRAPSSAAACLPESSRPSERWPESSWPASAVCSPLFGSMGSESTIELSLPDESEDMVLAQSITRIAALVREPTSIIATHPKRFPTARFGRRRPALLELRLHARCLLPRSTSHR